MKTDFASIPQSHRFIELVSPGLLFGDTSEMKWPKESWSNIEELAAELRKQKNSIAVGFRRFIYHSEHGKRYKDRGWVYFKGVKVSKEDALSGKAKAEYPGIPLNDIAISNIRINDCDCLYIEEYGKLWPLYAEDKLV